MPITRLDLKNRILSSRGLTRARADGLLGDDLLNEAVRDAQELVVQDCNLFPVEESVALQEDKYEYPVPEEFLDIKEVWFCDASDNWLPLDQVSYDEFIGGRNPATDVALEPVYYAFPKFQRRTIQPFGIAPPNMDFVEYSFVTSDSIRTVTDTSINLGRTRTGRRISPGDIVFNRSDGPDERQCSYGIVEVIDFITQKVTGTATVNTSATRLYDTTKNFPSNTPRIQVDDIIVVRDSDLIVITYGFVTDVGINYLDYESVRGSATAFASGDTYRVGTAQKIRLSSASPHRGLRGGISNRFDVAAASATLTGTTFTETRVTGSGSLASVSVGQVAVAAGGSQGEVTEIGSGYLVVKHWTGGVPAAGEQVTVRTADKYSIATRPAIERVLQLGPTPTTTDTLGRRSIKMLSNRRPIVAQYDWEELEVGEEYRRPLYVAAYWMAAELTGLYDPNRLEAFANQYRAVVLPMRGNSNKTKVDAIISPWINQKGGRYGRRYQGSKSGITWNVRGQL